MYPKMLTRHQPGGCTLTHHQTAPLTPMYGHARVNTHTTTHAPFNDKHSCTRSSNNQSTPTAQHQRHQATTTNTPPQPTTPTTHTHDTSSLPTTTPTSTGPTPTHNRAHTNNHAAADNRSRCQQTQERRRTAPDRPHPSHTPATHLPGSGQRRRQAHRTNPQVRIGETEGITG